MWHVIAQTNRQAGFSLIELLVAVLILSIGLLGVAGLQTRSLQMNRSASLHSQATYLSAEIVERMRANRDAALAGAYDVEAGVVPAGNDGPGRDLHDWKGAVYATLPMVEGLDTGASVEVDNAGRVTITISWFDARWSDDPDQQLRQVQLVTEL